jgi:hypothetical protein
MTDAFLNGGQHVDLTALVKAVGPAIGVSFPDGVEVGIALGGLLSPGGSVFNALDFAYDNDLLGVLHIHVPLATGTPVGPIGSFMDLARTIAKAIGWNGVGNASAAPSSAAQSLAAANEVPRSVLNSGTANAVTNRSAKVDNTIRDVARPASGALAAMHTVGGRHRADGLASRTDQPNSAAADSGGAPKAGTKRSARTAAAANSG